MTDDLLYKLWALALDTTESEFKQKAPALLDSKPAAIGNVAQPLSIMCNAFRVTETEGNPDPEKRRFHMRFTFRSMEELHAADDQWCAFISGSESSPANVAQGAEAWEMDWPEYSYDGTGCGLEDRNITDRYDAMKYGWDEALERVGQILERDGPLYTAPPAQSAVD